jgi:hypothetical protein
LIIGPPGPVVMATQPTEPPGRAIEMVLSTAMTHIRVGSNVVATDYSGREIAGEVESIDRMFEHVLFYTVRLPLLDPNRPWEVNRITIWPERDPIALA